MRVGQPGGEGHQARPQGQRQRLGHLDDARPDEEARPPGEPGAGGGQHGQHHAQRPEDVEQVGQGEGEEPGAEQEPHEGEVDQGTDGPGDVLLVASDGAVGRQGRRPQAEALRQGVGGLEEEAPDVAGGVDGDERRHQAGEQAQLVGDNEAQHHPREEPEQHGRGHQPPPGQGGPPDDAVRLLHQGRVVGRVGRQGRQQGAAADPAGAGGVLEQIDELSEEPQPEAGEHRRPALGGEPLEGAPDGGAHGVADRPGRGEARAPAPGVGGRSRIGRLLGERHPRRGGRERQEHHRRRRAPRRPPPAGIPVRESRHRCTVPT